MAAFTNGAEAPPKAPANYQALTPLHFLERTATLYPDKLAIVHGALRRTYAEFHARARRLASALQRRGVRRGDVVAAMLSNTPEHIEAHFGVPMSGAVLNPLNYRLDVRNVTFMLRHAQARILFVDREFSKVTGEAIAALEAHERPLVVDVDDPMCPEPGPRIGALSYEDLLAEGDPQAPWAPPDDEWDTLSLCYTSGTTSDPKGVLLHHRGGYLMTLDNIVKWAMPKHPVYLWTLPMFHCNGWYFHYSVTAIAGTHVCLRKVVANDIFQAIAEHGVDHLCGAPIVMSTMLQYAGPRTWSHRVKMMTAASAPPAPILARMAEFGIDVTHVYGLTETYGPALLCEWKNDAWDSLGVPEQATLKARQGVRGLSLEHADVVDPETGRPVPRDGETIGEVVMRGNVVMKGYLRNPAATAKDFRNGVFNSGDLAVIHPDGYIQLKDRSKDIIISGGENISTLEVESLLLKHPKILETAVVARPDDKWGETPVAWIVCRPGDGMTDEEIYAWCRETMPRYMVPRTFMFESLDRVKTSTGKVQKHVLRSLAKEMTKPPMTITSADDAEKTRSKL
uniref:AMP-dependent synthetase/ligase domain-containing protein n=1 Tax=Zooxanthella nutricula TaxID=1333877 RepID=A0A6U8XX33_9DINO